MKIYIKKDRDPNKGFINKIGNKYLNGECYSFIDVKALFFPILLDQTFMAFISVFNSSMISSSGASAVSAVNMVDSLNFFLMNVFVAIATGGTVVVSQYMGRRDKEKAGHTATQSILSCTITSSLVAIFIVLFSTTVLNVLFGKADQEVMDNARIYLVGCCFSYPLYAIFQASLGALRGVGDSKASMVFSIIMNVEFLIGNIITIKLMNMGVYGIVVSMFIARSTGAIIALVYLIRTRTDLSIKVHKFFKIDFALQKSILYIGLPCAAEQLFFHGGKIITQTFIVSLGLTSMTSNAIAGSLSNMLCIPENTIVLCIVTIVGTCIGAGNMDEAKMFLKNLVITACVLTGIVCVVAFPFLPNILQLYSPSPAVFDSAYKLIVMYSIGAPFLLCVGFVFPAGLRAAGDAKYTSITALLSMWLFRVILGYILGIVLHMDIYGVWVAMILEWGVRGFFFWIRFRGDKWYKHNFI